MPRVILHLDLDAFYCAVEETRDPSLRGKPFAVGGRPEERGVVSSCSYAARAFGVRSAMPMSRALRICPNLIVVSGHHRVYSEASEKVMAKLRDLTPLVEQISIDEAFLDLSDIRDPIERLARDLQARVRDDLGLPCSIGIATNKLVAKIATEVGKKAAQRRVRPAVQLLGERDVRPAVALLGERDVRPAVALLGERDVRPAVALLGERDVRPAVALLGERDVRPAVVLLDEQVGPPFALTVVPAGEDSTFLAPLPADMLWGVGPKTMARLNEIGIHTIGDIANYPEAELVARFGENGRDLWRHAQGRDDRPIVTEHETKSISQETTFVRDVSSDRELEKTIREQSASVAKQLRKNDLAGKTVKLKLRWPDFTTLSRQTTLAQATDLEEEIASTAAALLKSVRRSGQAVRLIGVGVSGLGPPIRQLSLWDDGGEKSRKLQEAVDALQEKYGSTVIHKGTK
jgi:nucleotidyltransferase/DNA polymerase involved in DNA repair